MESRPRARDLQNKMKDQNRYDMIWEEEKHGVQSDPNLLYEDTGYLRK